MDERKGTISISMKIKQQNNSEEYTVGTGYNYNGEEMIVDALAKYVTKIVNVSEIDAKEFLEALAKRMME